MNKHLKQDPDELDFECENIQQIFKYQTSDLPHFAEGMHRLSEKGVETHHERIKQQLKERDTQNYNHRKIFNDNRFLWHLYTITVNIVLISQWY